MSRRSKAKRKRSRQAKHDTQASRAEYDQQYEDKGRDAPTGYHATPTMKGLGRGGARLAAHCLSLGVIPEELAADLLRSAAEEAKYQFAKHDPRGAASMMRILLQAGKLELETVVASNKAGGPMAPVIPHGGDGRQGGISFMEHASQEDLQETAQILDSLGLLRVETPAENETPPRR